VNLTALKEIVNRKFLSGLGLNESSDATKKYQGLAA
jgi:hypothetical protein